jgi:peptidyl-prolyl cis-trans isomerase A (cyclophilin A)
MQNTYICLRKIFVQNIKTTEMKALKKTLGMMIAGVTLFTSSCSAKSGETASSEINSQTEQPETTMQPKIADDPSWREKDGLYAVISTVKGDIVIRLEHKKTPMTVGHFVGLAEGKIKNDSRELGTPFYDGLIFHRCIDNFMIQGGDPLGTGMGGPGYRFPDEIVADLRHDGPGVLSMANAGPGTNGSQFFITHKETPWLDGKHTVFGRVVVGQSVVSAIKNGDAMNKVEIVRVGKEAAAFEGAKAFEEGKNSLAKREEDAKKNAAAAWDNKVKQAFPKAKRTASGLYYIIEQEGKGAQAVKGKQVSVHYTGTFWDGTKFDSSLDRGQPLPFTLGTGQVIPGWDEGVALMKVGTKAKLIIPYFLAYGEQGYPGAIPPMSDLIFDTELIEVK